MYILPKVNKTSLTSMGSATVKTISESKLYSVLLVFCLKIALRFWQVLFQRRKRLGQVEWSCIGEADYRLTHGKRLVTEKESEAES